MITVPFMHKENVRSTRDIWVDCNWKDAYVVRVVGHLPVEIVEMVSPEFFNIPRIHPTMAIRGALDEEHRR